MRKIKLLIVAILLIQGSAFAANDSTPEIKNHFFEYAWGNGLDYAGLFGLQFSYITPIPYFSVFVAGGAHVTGLNYNVGVKIHLRPENDKVVFRPNVKVMYGVNCFTYVLGDPTSDYKKAYTGFTPGFGLEFMFGKGRHRGFDIDVDFPLRPDEFYDTVDAMKADSYITAVTEPNIFTISVGFHREF